MGGGGTLWKKGGFLESNKGQVTQSGLLHSIKHKALSIEHKSWGSQSIVSVKTENQLKARFRCWRASSVQGKRGDREKGASAACC